MGASNAGGSFPRAAGLGAQAVEDAVARSLTLPRALIDANFRASAALLEFAGHCVHAETEFLERLFACRDLEQAASLHARFVATMIDEGGRELTVLMALARENVALIADATAPTTRSAP